MESKTKIDSLIFLNFLLKISVSLCIIRPRFCLYPLREKPFIIKNSLPITYELLSHFKFTKNIE